MQLTKVSASFRNTKDLKTLRKIFTQCFFLFYYSNKNKKLHKWLYINNKCHSIGDILIGKTWIKLDVNKKIFNSKSQKVKKY